jgi:hypothetical protein
MSRMIAEYNGGKLVTADQITEVPESFFVYENVDSLDIMHNGEIVDTLYFSGNSSKDTIQAARYAARNMSRGFEFAKARR